MTRKMDSYYFEPPATNPNLNIIMSDISGYGWYPFLVNLGDALYYICASPNNAQETISSLPIKQIVLGSNNKLAYVGQAKSGSNTRIKISGMNNVAYPITFMPLRPGTYSSYYCTPQ